MRLGSLLVICLMGVVAAGCTRVQSDVTRFHELSADSKGKSFFMLPTKDQDGSLEYRQYAEAVAQKLEAAGYVRKAELLDSDYAVAIQYTISDGKTVTSEMPLFGQTGGGTSYQSGTIMTPGGGMSSYSGSTYTPPTYGVVGSTTTSHTYYTRQLSMDIIDTHKSSERKLYRVFEGKVVSTGSSGSFAKVSQCLINAMFDNFPGESGKTIRTEVGPDCMK